MNKQEHMDAIGKAMGVKGVVNCYEIRKLTNGPVDLIQLRITPTPLQAKRLKEVLKSIMGV